MPSSSGKKSLIRVIGLSLKIFRDKRSLNAPFFNLKCTFCNSDRDVRSLVNWYQYVDQPCFRGPTLHPMALIDKFTTNRCSSFHHSSLQSSTSSSQFFTSCTKTKIRINCPGFGALGDQNLFFPRPDSRHPPLLRNRWIIH